MTVMFSNTKSYLRAFVSVADIDNETSKMVAFMKADTRPIIRQRKEI